MKSHRQLKSSPSPLPHPQDLFSSNTNSLSPILTNFIFGSLEIQWNYCDLFLFFLKNDLAMEVEIAFSLKLLQVGLYKHISKSLLFLFVKFVMYFYSFSQAL